MLAQILVSNYAVVDEVELDLDGGLTVLTGETGAGKSILVDALGLVLGDRADSTVIRHGADRTEITAVFELETHESIIEWLHDQDLDSGHDCVLRRVINREGRSRGYVNSRPVPMQTLKSLGALLVEIHGQHEHQSLTRSPVQRAILDTYGGLEAEVASLAGRYDAWKDARETMDRLTGSKEDRAHRIDLLRYQCQELEALAPESGELEKLEAEHRRLASSGQLAEGAALALDLAYDNDNASAQRMLGLARSELDRLGQIDSALGPILNLLEEADIRVTEAADELRRYRDTLETDPTRQAALEDRIAGIREMARKHQVEADDLSEKLRELGTELEQLDNADIALADAQSELDKAARQYSKAAKTLSGSRSKAANKLGESVTGMMQQLGMPAGSFVVEVERDDERFSVNGLDKVSFMVTANPGQPPAPLQRVASGGELSRISLALQVVATRATSVACLVFDEIDSGVGGGVAEIVGQRLRDLGDRHQVLCVTHLPQVASQGHQHVRVNKLSDGKVTRTTLTALGRDQRVEELARMLGGVEITETSRQHAREMLARGNEDRAAV